MKNKYVVRINSAVVAIKRYCNNINSFIDSLENSFKNIDLWNLYCIGYSIMGIITFISSWIYCIVTYGYLFGVGLGWLPSVIVAVIAGSLWPITVFAVWIFLTVIFGLKAFLIGFIPLALIALITREDRP